MERDGQNLLPFWVNFCPFTPLTIRKIKVSKNEKNTWRYYHFTHVHHKWQSYDVWFLRYGARQTEFFVILDRFLPFYPPNDPENKNFEKTKKAPGHIILQKCTKNHDHIPHCYWDMTPGGCNFCVSYWAIFCPFTI